MFQHQNEANPTVNTKESHRVRFRLKQRKQTNIKHENKTPQKNRFRQKIKRFKSA